MSTADPHPPQDQPAPRWLLALLAGGAVLVLAAGALLWLQRGSALVLELAEFFCL